MTRLRRWLSAAIALVALLPACGGDTLTGGGRKAARTSPAFSSQPPMQQPTDALPKCRKPKRVDYPEWVPDDLPLPEGIYAYKNLPPIGGYERALFVMNFNTQRFTKYVLREWPKAGYTLGRGDAEPGEVEDDFHKPPAVGAFKANDVVCSPGYTIMYLIWAPEGPKGMNVLPSPTSTGSALKG